MELTLSDSEILITPKFDKVLQKQNYQSCQSCGLHYIKSCSFCSNSNEEFEFESKSPLNTTLIIYDFESQVNIELFNAGISDYDQVIKAQEIKKLLEQNKQPHEIAIELGCYTKEELDKLINNEVSKLKQKETTLFIDLISLSSSQSFEQKAQKQLDNLNRKYDKICKSNTPLETLNEILSQKNDIMEIIIFTNQNRDLGKYQSHHIINYICCGEANPLQYKNICRLNGGKSIKLDEQLGEIPSIMKIVINQQNVFVDYDSNVVFISNFDWPLQIQSTGKYIVQFHSMSSHIYQRVYQGPQSESLKLTQYSKQ